MQRVSKLVRLSYAHKMGLYGQGIVVAVVDSGIAKHADIADRLIASADMINHRKDFYDDNGHGTHVAGIIGANGSTLKGMAPKCEFVSVKVLDGRGGGKIENVLAGLRWLYDNADRYKVRIINISVGTPAGKDVDEDSELVRMVDMLWNRGYIVLAAAGNNGPKSYSVGAPGISRKIITVGASDDSVEVTDGMRYTKMRNYSGRGPTNACIKKPDIVAPGSGILSCNNMYGKRRYSVKSGTSMATPVVSGAVALLLSKYPDMTNREVKIRLKDTAVDLGLPHSIQGWGMLDVKRLVGDK